MLPYAAILAVACALAPARVVPERWILAVAGSVLVAGAVAGTWSWMHRIMLCDVADRFIALGIGATPSPAVVAERRALLVSAADRRAMGRSLRGLVESARSPSRVLVRVPVDRGAILADAAMIAQVAERLERMDDPVSPRAAALVHMLVTDAASPVYGDVDPEGGELHRRLAEIACALAIDETA